MKEADAKLAIIVQFKVLVVKTMEEKNVAFIYPYSTTSRVVPITSLSRLPNVFMELKNSDVVYGQIYIGTTTEYTDWNTNVLEWTKDNGHGGFIKYLQNERITPVGYL